MRIAKQVRGVKCRHHFDAEIILKVAADLGDPVLCVQQIVQGRITHHHDHLRPDNRDLAQQERPARVCLGQRRSAIARRAAAVDVADGNVLTLVTECLR